jgi:hypothetical protein
MATETIFQNEYRFVWIDPTIKGEQFGTFLFNTPDEANDSYLMMQATFPDFIIWLEDHERNKIEI